MGSGTTAKVAFLNNRKWLGSEISKEYVEIAEKRLQKHTTDNLFANGFSQPTNAKKINLISI